jgi:hypothetical protein
LIRIWNVGGHFFCSEIFLPTRFDETQSYLFKKLVRQHEN